MNALITLSQNTPEAEAYQLAEKLLRPSYQLTDAIVAALALNPSKQKIVDDHKKKKDKVRSELMALPIEALRKRVEQQEAQAAADRVARAESENKRKQGKAAREVQAAAEREANKFYNLESSKADFQYWATMDYWTLDEALALLMGKDPRVMTRTAMKKEIEPEFSLMLFTEPAPPKSDFVLRYEALRAIAARAASMKPPQLKPLAVLLWAHESGAISPPAELVHEISSRLQRSKPGVVQPVAVAQPTQTESPPIQAPEGPDTHTQLKRAALVQSYERVWPSIEADLRHASDNGLSTAAKTKTHGYWYEKPALEWARRNGKLLTPLASRTAAAHSPFGQMHRIDD